MQRPGDDQPTVFSEAANAGLALPTAADAPSEVSAAAANLDLPAGIARRTGIVFVHGIGTQTPAETFLDWSTPIVELLTDWRAAVAESPSLHGGSAGLGAATAPSTASSTRKRSAPGKRSGRDKPSTTGDPPGVADRIDDPVWRAEFSFNAASPPYLEIAVPAHAGIPGTTWVVTEAWWAADLRPPGLGRTIDYLRRRMSTVVAGIAAGYSDRTRRFHDLAVAMDVIGEGKPPLDWRLIERLDEVQSLAFGSRPVGLIVGGLGAIVLAVYDLLRRIPIPVIREFAARRMIDSFLVDWFGDLPVLLDDPVQSANVRARLARSIQRLVDDGCDAIVVVAHSGGALVTFETLLDPAYHHLRVDKLVTLGQGLGLAWRLAADPGVHEITPGSRLVGNLARARPGLRWVDVWASYDPAPAGPLPARGGLQAADAAGAAAVPRAPAILVTSGTPAVPAILGMSATSATQVATGDEQTDAWLLRAPVALPGQTPLTIPPASIMVESRPVTNEMNVLTDHGAYWANPEGFLIPLIRHLDAARGDAEASRFFRDRADRTRRIVWRRQRVSALAAWGWLCSLGAILTVLVLMLLQGAGNQRLTTAGHRLVAVWDGLPGHEIVSGPLTVVGAIVGAMLRSIGLEAVASGLASLGPVVLAIAVLTALFFALARVGTARWHDWDGRERRAMHPEIPNLPDRSVAAGQALALCGGLVGLMAASLGYGLIAALAIVLGTAAGGVVWVRRPFRAVDRASGPRPG